MDDVLLNFEVLTWPRSDEREPALRGVNTHTAYQERVRATQATR